MPITTLSYGFEKPTSPTYGDLFFAALERNITKLNDHTHNGTNSAPIAKQTSTISAASWGADLGGGTYRQTITMPTGLTFDASTMDVRVTSTGEKVYPKIVKSGTSAFYIYTNDSSAAYTVLYV